MDSTTPGSYPAGPRPSGSFGPSPSGRFALEPGQAFGNYVVERELARGGQGAIMVARHVTLGTPVALKLLLHGDAVSRARFLREAQVLARLSSPHVPRVSDLGEHGGVSYMAMELIEGEDLHRRLLGQGLPEPAWAARVMAHVARVVQACHDQGILHRDLKPHNVLIEQGTERPVLVDFGLLKKDDTVEGGLTVGGGSLSLSGELKGTPAYMAPEQADSSLGPVGRATDVYALGATLHHLLTGQPPYTGTTSYNIITSLLRATRAPDPRTLQAQVPASLAAICAAAMAPEPSERIASAGELAVQLDMAADALEGKPTGGRGASPRTALLTSALVAIGGLGGAVAIVASADRGPVSPSPVAASPTGGGAAGDGEASGAGDGSGAEGDEAADGTADPAAALGPPPDDAELRFETIPRGGFAGLPLVVDVDGDGPLDIVAHNFLPRQGGNAAEVVAYSGADGRVLWTYDGPVNRYAQPALRTRGDHAPALVVGEIYSQQSSSAPALAVLSVRSGRALDHVPLDARGNYRREPLTPVALDVGGTGERGYAVVCDMLNADSTPNGQERPAFVGLGLRGDTDHGLPILPEYWRSERWRSKHLNNHGLFVTPVARRDGAAGLLWYYRGVTLLLNLPEGRILDRFHPTDRLSRWRGAIQPPPPSRHGSLLGWSAEARDTRPEGVELALLDRDWRIAWQAVVAHGKLGHQGLARVELEPRRELLAVATVTGDLVLIDEATGARVRAIENDALVPPLGSVQLVHAGERRLLGVAVNVKPTAERADPSDLPRYLLLDPARDDAVVWARALRSDHFRFVVAADLDADGRDELLTSDDMHQLVVLTPAPR